MQIKEAIEDYLHYLQWIDKKSDNTVSSYQNDLNKYQIYLDFPLVLLVELVHIHMLLSKLDQNSF